VLPQLCRRVAHIRGGTYLDIVDNALVRRDVTRRLEPPGSIRRSRLLV
jgi:hypothetical protein